MKNVALMLGIAIAAAALTPRDREEASVLVARLAVALVKIAVALSPPGYDAGFEPDTTPPTEDARVPASGSHLS